MDDPTHSNPHCRFAGRLPAGTAQTVTLKKNGIRHTRRLPCGTEKEVLSIGLACSECFSGVNLHKVLKRGLQYELNVMEDLIQNQAAGPLSIHTSSGVPEALSEFMEALEPHLPWKDHQSLDWCVSLQLEGASAVWAAVDMLLQVQMLETGNKNRTKVAVAATSYHGPPSTSFGAKSPLWTKTHQVLYPAPKVGTDMDEAQLLAEFETFLDEHAHEVGVLLVEPQWGSSQGGLPWPRHLVYRYIQMAQECGIKVICDEIMCGLGRHGYGTLFVSEAWDLNPDAITFGKAIGAGVFPLAGAILKQGRNRLHMNQCSVMQSHTYAGSSVRALMAATDVLNELPSWFSTIHTNGKEMEQIFQYLNKISNGLVSCNGQGLMWGGVFSYQGPCQDPTFRQNVITTFKKYCNEENIIPYHIPVGGFMVSPVLDMDVTMIYEIGQRLEQVLLKTMNKVGWEKEGYHSSSSSCLPPLRSIESESSLLTATSVSSSSSSASSLEDDVVTVAEESSFYREDNTTHKKVVTII